MAKPPLLSRIAALAAYGVITLVWYLKPERRQLVYVAMPSKPQLVHGAAFRNATAGPPEPEAQRVQPQPEQPRSNARPGEGGKRGTIYSG
jgi:hypothetical protein